MIGNKVPRLLIPVVVSLVCVALALEFQAAGRHAQRESPRTVRANGVQADGDGAGAPSKVAAGAGSRVSNAAAFASAAARNAQLETSLVWTFGGKAQHGWSLYAPLIAHVIGCEEDRAPSEFALRLSAWQESRSLAPSGVLDSETWSQMVSALQSRRLKDKSYPTASQLVTIPTSDIYDPERPEELRKVDRDTFEAYRRMVAAAAADASLGLELTSDGQLTAGEKFFKIISAFRSREYQDQLRKQSPTSGRAGLAVNSPHFTGRALDLYVGGEPVSTKDENRSIQTRTLAYRWLVKNASRFGFQPYFYEPWHWEYVGVPNNRDSSRPGDTAK